MTLKEFVEWFVSLVAIVEFCFLAALAIVSLLPPPPEGALR